MATAVTADSCGLKGLGDALGALSPRLRKVGAAPAPVVVRGLDTGYAVWNGYIGGLDALRGLDAMGGLDGRTVD